MAVSNPLLGIYLKQFSHVSDQVADFVNVYGFRKTANLLENSTHSVNLSQTFYDYGSVTLGLTWLPGRFSLE